MSLLNSIGLPLDNLIQNRHIILNNKTSPLHMSQFLTDIVIPDQIRTLFNEVLLHEALAVGHLDFELVFEQLGGRQHGYTLDHVLLEDWLRHHHFGLLVVFLSYDELTTFLLKY